MSYGEHRHGIFLAPPPELADVACRATAVVERMFGFAAAAAYPPHITVLGSIATGGPEDALAAAVEESLTGIGPIAAHNAGFTAEIGHAVGYDLSRLADGSPNRDLQALFRCIRDTTAPARLFTATDRTAATRRAAEEAGRFAAHLTVLGHDGADRPAEARRARRTLERSGLAGPAELVLDEVVLYRFASRDWSGRYWETMTWEARRSWPLR